MVRQVSDRTLGASVAHVRSAWLSALLLGTLAAVGCASRRPVASSSPPALAPGPEPAPEPAPTPGTAQPPTEPRLPRWVLMSSRELRPGTACHFTAAAP